MAPKASPNKRFGKAVSAARLRKGWTQDELAHAMKVSQSAVSLWEQGHPPRNIPALEKKLGITDASLVRAAGFPVNVTVAPARAMTPEEAIEADDTLSDTEKAGLVSMLSALRTRVAARRGA